MKCRVDLSEAVMLDEQNAGEVMARFMLLELSSAAKRVPTHNTAGRHSKDWMKLQRAQQLYLCHTDDLSTSMNRVTDSKQHQMDEETVNELVVLYKNPAVDMHNFQALT